MFLTLIDKMVSNQFYSDEQLAYILSKPTLYVEIWCNRCNEVIRKSFSFSHIGHAGN